MCQLGIKNDATRRISNNRIFNNSLKYYISVQYCVPYMQYYVRYTLV